MVESGSTRINRPPVHRSYFDGRNALKLIGVGLICFAAGKLFSNEDRGSSVLHHSNYTKESNGKNVSCKLESVVILIAFLISLHIDIGGRRKHGGDE